MPYTLLWIVERNENWKFMNFLRKSDTLYTAIISMSNILKKMHSFGIWKVKTTQKASAFGSIYCEVQLFK